MSAAGEQTVAAVVVTYNRKTLLEECLSALLSQTRPLDCVIIIDNASTDGTQELLREKGYLNNPKIDYVRLAKNTGGAGGFHEGVKRGCEKGYDWLWLMDDDAEPKEDALEKIFASGLHMQDDTVGIACLKVGIDGSVQKIHRGHYIVKSQKPVPLCDNDYAREVVPIGYSSFVGLFIRSNVINDIGLPRKDFFIWYDDVEYCLRLNSKGRLYLVRDSVIWHKDGRVESLTRRKKRMPIQQYWRAYYGLRNPLLILKVHEKSIMGRIMGYLFMLYRFLRMVTGVIIYDDYKLLRTRIILRACIDGVRGCGGKKYDPSFFGKID